MNEQRHILRRAFPSSIVDKVNDVLNIMDLDSTPGPEGRFCALVGNETLEIPYRVYYKESNLEAGEALPSVQGEILNCLFTRHHNGYIREKCARRIITSDNAWVLPYIFRLLGEYVVEILYVMERNLGKLNMDACREFLISNREFYATTRQRVVSYWNCYYRRQYPKTDDYVGFKIVRFFDQFL